MTNLLRSTLKTKGMMKNSVADDENGRTFQYACVTFYVKSIMVYLPMILLQEC